MRKIPLKKCFKYLALGSFGLIAALEAYNQIVVLPEAIDATKANYLHAVQDIPPELDVIIEGYKGLDIEIPQIVGDFVGYAQRGDTKLKVEYSFTKERLSKTIYVDLGFHYHEYVKGEADYKIEGATLIYSNRSGDSELFYEKGEPIDPSSNGIYLPLEDITLGIGI